MGKKKPEIEEDTPVAPDPEIARVKSALTPLPSAEDLGEDDVVVAEPEPEAKVPTRKKKAASGGTHVVTDWCGELLFGGKRYLAGEAVTLTPEEAAAIGPKNVESI